MNTSYRETLLDQPKTILIDAKQRAINATQRGGIMAICAEKSPDVFSVLSASFGAEATYKLISAAVSGAKSEAGSYTGLRTHLTEVQSQLLYRLCEAYANGAMDKNEFETQIRRFPTYVVSMFAIEQLTNVNRQPAIVITAGAASSSAGMPPETAKLLDGVRKDAEKTSADAAKDLEEKQKRVKEITDSISEKEKALAAAAGDDMKTEREKLQGEIKDLKEKQLPDADAKLKFAEAAKSDADEKQQEVQKAITQTVSATSEAGKGGGQTNSAVQTESSTNSISEAVARIVEASIFQTHGYDICLKRIMDPQHDRLSETALKTCQLIIESWVKIRVSEQAAAAALAVKQQETYKATYLKYLEAVGSQRGVGSGSVTNAAGASVTPATSSSPVQPPIVPSGGGGGGGGALLRRAPMDLLR